MTKPKYQESEMASVMIFKTANKLKSPRAIVGDVSLEGFAGTGHSWTRAGPSFLIQARKQKAQLIKQAGPLDRTWSLGLKARELRVSLLNCIIKSFQVALLGNS